MSDKTVHEESEELLEYFKTEEGAKRFKMIIFEDEVSVSWLRISLSVFACLRVSS